MWPGQYRGGRCGEVTICRGLTHSFCFYFCRDEAAMKAKELGEDGPVLQKYYGDAQLEAAMKYKKGVSWAKRWKKMTENDKKSKFVIAVPDGTTFC